jgi:hypothetical protein
MHSKVNAARLLDMIRRDSADCLSCGADTAYCPPAGDTIKSKLALSDNPVWQTWMGSAEIFKL